MKTIINLKIKVLLIALISFNSTSAHPTGDMISVGDQVLWSYIDPIDDPEHHACIMIWEPGAAPKVLVKSEYPGSDYMLYNRDQVVYIIERRFVQHSQSHRSRILKMRIGESPTAIWSWFEDTYRVGEGGFLMISDDHIVFGGYPHVYHLTKGEEPKEYLDIDFPVRRIRAIGKNNLLLLGDDTCRLTDLDGNIIEQWVGLLNDSIDNTPLNLNLIFDADYHEGELLFAYWGQRSFEYISSSGERKILVQQEEPFTPHWVAFHKNEKLLFSSKLIFDGSAPKPFLILLNRNDEKLTIWEMPND